MPRLKRRAQEVMVPVVTEGRSVRKKRSCTESIDCDHYNGQDLRANSLTNSIRLSSCAISRPHSYEEQLLPLLNASYGQPNCCTGDQSYGLNKHTMLKTMLNVSSHHHVAANQLMGHADPAGMLPIHPNVSFAPHPFYDDIGNDGQVMRVTTLMSQQPPHFVKGENSASYTFSLSSRQVALFPQGRLRDQFPGQENDVSVLLRFCKYDMSSEQEDSLPVHLSVSCNNISVSLQCPLPTNKTGMDGRRIGRPVDITNQVYFVAGTPNTLSVHWHYDPDNKFQCAVYCLAIFLVKRLTPNDLMKKLQCRVKADDMSKRMIRQQLAAEDAELSMRCLGASLLCPLGKTRIGLPLRALACRHVQCFDAFCYLAMNERRPTWRCPACDEAAPFRDLYVDAYFRTILAEARPGATRIEFAPDGSWTARGDEEDDDEEEEEEREAQGASQAGASSARPPLTSSSCSSSAPPASCSTSAVDAAVIDLTGSDDDEPPAPVRQSPSPASPRHQQQQQPPQPPARPTAAAAGASPAAAPADSTSGAARTKPARPPASAPAPAPAPAPPQPEASRRKNPAPTRLACPTSKRPRLRPVTPTEVIDLESSDEGELDNGPSYAPPPPSSLGLPHPSAHLLGHPPMQHSSANSSSSSSSVSSAATPLPPHGLPGLHSGHQYLHEHGKSPLAPLLHPYSGMPGLDHLLPPPVPQVPQLPHHTAPSALPGAHPHPLLSAPRHYATSQGHPGAQPGPCLPHGYGHSSCSPGTAAVAVAAAVAAAGVPPNPLGHPVPHSLSPYSQTAHLNAMSNFSFLHYSPGASNPTFNGTGGPGAGSPCTMSPDGGYFV